ncbi:MAG: hypothetical protein R3C14_15215 [Caldilineaceae bacterium]
MSSSRRSPELPLYYTTNSHFFHTAHTLNVAAGEIYRFEGRSRLLRFAEPDPARRTANMAILRIRGFSAGDGQKVWVRMGEQWQDWCLDYVVPNGASYVAFFLSPAVYWEPHDLLVDFLRIHRIA